MAGAHLVAKTMKAFLKRAPLLKYTVMTGFFPKIKPGFWQDPKGYIYLQKLECWKGG